MLPRLSYVSLCHPSINSQPNVVVFYGNINLLLRLELAVFTVYRLVTGISNYRYSEIPVVRNTGIPEMPVSYGIPVSHRYFDNPVTGIFRYGDGGATAVPIHGRAISVFRISVISDNIFVVLVYSYLTCVM